jgi:hypothetical protein
MPDPSAPTYLNLVTYSKAVSSPSKSPDLKYQLKIDVLSNKSKKENKSISSTSKSIPMSTSTSSLSLKQQNEPTTVDSAPKIDFRPRIEPPNTVKVMATVQGPLGALRIAMENKKRVKVDIILFLCKTQLMVFFFCFSYRFGLDEILGFVVI